MYLYSRTPLLNIWQMFTKFTSCSQAIIDHLASIEIANKNPSQQNIDDNYQKLLGLLWNIQTDALELRSINHCVKSAQIRKFF